MKIIISCLSLEDTNEIPFYILSFIFLYVFFYNLLGKFNDKNSFSELFSKISIFNEINIEKNGIDSLLIIRENYFSLFLLKDEIFSYILFTTYFSTICWINLMIRIHFQWFSKISILNEIVSRKMNLMKLDEYFGRDLSFRIFLWRIRRNFFLYSVSSVLHIDDSRLRFPIVFQNIDTQSKLY